MPDLEPRVSGLEANVDRIMAVLTRLEPKLAEIAFTTARSSDLGKLQLTLTELSTSAAKSADLNKLQLDTAEIKGRVSSLPTWWMLVVTVLSTWLAGAGIVSTVVKATHP